MFADVRGARIAVFGAPAIDGLGTTGGFKMQVQDLRGAGLRSLQGAVQNLADQGNADPRLVGLFSSFSVNQPQLFVEIDREKLKSQKVSLDDVNLTLQTYLGSMYVNDFTKFNRNWQVNVQAEPRSRLRREDIGRLEVRSATGNSVPLSTLIKVKDDSGPAVVNRYNSYPSAEINGNPAPGVSSGQAIDSDERPVARIAAGLDGQRMDRDHACSKSSPSKTCSRSWRSHWPWFSCFSSCPHSTKVGRCRCRSS